MVATMTLTGMMELKAAGKEGSGSHVLNYLGGSIFLPKDTIQGVAKVGEVKEAILTGELRKADFGVGFQPVRAVLKS